MRKDYFNQSIRAVQLAGMSERTCECYTRSVRQLVEFYDQTPDQTPDKISETQFQNYFLHRKNKNNWSAATLRICYSGIKFFFVNVLKRDWHTATLTILRDYWKQHRNPVLGFPALGRGGTSGPTSMTPMIPVLPSIREKNVERSILCSVHAVIGIVPPARIIKPGNGWRSKVKDRCRDIILW